MFCPLPPALAGLGGSGRSWILGEWWIPERSCRGRRHPGEQHGGGGARPQREQTTTTIAEGSGCRAQPRWVWSSGKDSAHGGGSRTRGWTLLVDGWLVRKDVRVVSQEQGPGPHNYSTNECWPT